MEELTVNLEKWQSTNAINTIHWLDIKERLVQKFISLRGLFEMCIH